MALCFFFPRLLLLTPLYWRMILLAPTQSLSHSLCLSDWKPNILEGLSPYLTEDSDCSRRTSQPVAVAAMESCDVCWGRRGRGGEGEKLACSDPRGDRVVVGKPAASVSVGRDL
jgi:hypothetical protein